MGKKEDKDLFESALEDEVLESFMKDEEDEIELDEEVETPLRVKVKFNANLRPYPNHLSKLIRRLRDGKEMEVLDIAEGSLVQLTNIWYEVEGGFVHASQVELM